MRKGNSVTAFLLDRALVFFNGNKRLLARRLQLRDHLEVYRWLTRFAEGGQSATASEALLRMYARENISVDKVLNEYSAHMDTMGDSANSLAYPCKHDNFAKKVHALRESMELTKSRNENTYVFLDLADNLMAQIEHMFCERKAGGSQCLYSQMKRDECPCELFGGFVDWVLRTYSEQDASLAREYEVDLDGTVD